MNRIAPNKFKRNFLSLLVTLAVASPLAAQRTVPSAYPSNVNVNFVRTWEAVAPEQNADNLPTRDVKDVRMSTQYLDGLGRPIQTVIRKGSLATGSASTDMVSPVVYDELQRTQFTYLPYADPGVTGAFKTNPFAAQASFMSGQFGVTQGDTWYYSQQNFEASPLSRVEESFAPGNAWVGTSGLAAGSRHSIKMKYCVNTAADAVRIWNVTDVTNDFGTYAKPVSPAAEVYPAGGLQKTITTDENQKQVIEFKDKDGRVILKKMQLTAADDNPAVGSGHAGWLCTYYIYDNLGNLRCVVQPVGVEKLELAGWVMSYGAGSLAEEQCFRYEYDKSNRMIMKKIPGAGAVYMVYDAVNRLIMMQDANLRNMTPKKWLYTTYDFLNRVSTTGLIRDNNSLAFHVAAAAGSNNYPDPVNNYVGYEVLTRNFYDDYSWLSAYPNALTSTYDNSYDASFEPVINSWPYCQANAASTAVKNLPTGTMTKVLGTNTWLYSLMVYNPKGQLIQSKSINALGNIDITTVQYTWAGWQKVLIQKTGGPSGNNQVAVSNFTYDELGRLLKTEKKMGATVPALSGPVIIAENEYNASGQVRRKSLGRQKDVSGNYTSTPIEKMDYEYNIRGWMLGMNRPFVKDEPAGALNYFGFDLGYEKNTGILIGGQGYTTPLYTGNITGTTWKSKGDNEKRKYDFTYDVANRLLTANFNQYTGGNFNKDANIDFSVTMGNGTSAYDANGNILGMTQKGLKLNTSPVIDKMLYQYLPNSNKLLSVTEDGTIGSADNKLGDFTDKNTSNDDYSYDLNGNMIADKNKAVTSIVYNYLNLPEVITITGKGTITYTYNAAGQKLKKETVETPSASNGNRSITTTTSYINGLVYETKNSFPVNTPDDNHTDLLQLIPFEEGRIRYIPGAATPYVYDYFIKDHLGNIRMVLTDEQKLNIYPAATMEGTLGGNANSMINTENSYYHIDASKVVSETAIASWGTESVANTKLYYNYNVSPPGNPSYPAGCTPVQTDGSSKLYQLNATTNKTGLEFLVKVMAGDKIDIMGKSYYLNTTTVTNANSTALNLLGLMTNFLTSPANAAGIKGFDANSLNTMNSGLVPSNLFRGANNESPTTVPKAYINYIFFDDQFKYAGSGFSRVGTSGVVKDHWNVDAALQNISAPKNGYLFVYVSNESNFNVYFDNLQVIHKPGPIVEETHYYPFGLVMAGISSRAAGNVENKFKYSGKEEQRKEFSDGSGIEWLDYGARMYDAQIGRWEVSDPLAQLYRDVSPYAFVKNNPLTNIEIDGRYFDEKNEEEARKNEKSIQEKIAELDKEISKLEKKNNDIGDRKERMKQLKQSLRDIRDMRKDDKTEYRYESVDSKEAKDLKLAGPATVATADGVVTMFTEKNMGSKLHESRHGGQNARGELDAKTKANYGVEDEVSAYKAQYSWSGSLEYLSHNINQFDPVISAMIEARIIPPGSKKQVDNINQIHAATVKDMGEFYSGMGVTAIKPTYNFK